VKRRDFILALGGAAAGGWPLAARAQQPAMPVIGYLSARSAESDVSMLAAFRRGLNETGYVVDQNVRMEFRFGSGQYDQLAALAADLVRRQVAVIVTGGGENPALAAKSATTKIPIVFTVGDDPVRSGLVASLNRPGGNITGVSTLFGGLGTKQLGLLRELLPKADLIAMLVNPKDFWATSYTSDTEAAARAVSQRLTVLTASTEQDIDAAFALLVEQRAAALLVAASPLFLTRAEHLIALSARHVLPTIYFRREMADAGGLMSYGPNTPENYAQMGIYAGKILNGANPADLPVVQPTKFELIINLKTAKALGLDVPLHLQQRADEVIE
jgi:putative ABC transport system substrate-binding protein